MVQAWPEELSDELWGEMVSAQRLPKVPLDALISELLDLAVNEPDRGEDGVLPALGVLRDRRFCQRSRQQTWP